MPVNSWSQVAPIGPYNSAMSRLPAGMRQRAYRRMSANASPEINSRRDSISRVARGMGIAVVAVKKKASPPLTGSGFFVGTPTMSVDWGEGAPTALVSDQVIEKTYSAPGTYTIIVDDPTSKIHGEHLFTI